jgi:hypothetical protein
MPHLKPWETPMPATADTTIVIRRAGAADGRVLARLAALDSARIPSADSLIAEADGVPVAALDLADGRVVADPFAPTADVVELLRLRAARVRGADDRRNQRTTLRRPLAGLTARA